HGDFQFPGISGRNLNPILLRADLEPASIPLRTENVSAPRTESFSRLVQAEEPCSSGIEPVMKNWIQFTCGCRDLGSLRIHQRQDRIARQTDASAANLKSPRPWLRDLNAKPVHVLRPTEPPIGSDIRRD